MFVFPEGYETEFVIETAAERQSEAGNDLIRLKLSCLDRTNGKWVGPIYTSLTFVDAAAWFIDGFILSTGGQVKKGQRVVIEAEDCIGKRGWCILGHWTVPGEGIVLNVVKKFIKRRVKASPPSAAQEPPDDLDTDGYDEEPPDDLPMSPRA